MDANGNLYITDNSKNEVVKETLNPGGFYTKSVLPVSGLNDPLGVAVDSHGIVYVADYLNDRVVKATPSGSTYTQSTVPTSSLSLPDAVAVDGSGNLYIADTLHARVLKENPSGTGYTESVVVSLHDFGGQFARSIAADGAGDVFILEYLSDETFTVLKETLSGGVYTQSSVPSFGQNPYAIAADAAGDVYIVSPGGGRLLKEFGPTTNFGPVNVTGTSAPISLTFTFDTAKHAEQSGGVDAGRHSVGLYECGHRDLRETKNYLRLQPGRYLQRRRRLQTAGFRKPVGRGGTAGCLRQHNWHRIRFRNRSGAAGKLSIRTAGAHRHSPGRSFRSGGRRARQRLLCGKRHRQCV